MVQVTFFCCPSSSHSFVRPRRGHSSAPAIGFLEPARAGTGKVGRRASLYTHTALARPHLDGGEHGGIRGQAENLIKQHKAQLASDRTSCRSPFANQMRLILHTGAYWLLLDVRDAIPKWHPLRHTEFATIRLRLLKIAARIIETASRIRIALASCCPHAETFSLVALALKPSGP